MKLIFVILIATTLAENGSCPTGDKYCLSCNGTQCEACVFSVLSNGKCVDPNTRINGCVGYLTSSTCAACDMGKNNLITSCPNLTIANCASETAGVCTACKNGKTPSSDGKSCTDTACSDANCDICTVVGTIQACSMCKSGYALDAN